MAERKDIKKAFQDIGGSKVINDLGYDSVKDLIQSNAGGSPDRNALKKLATQASIDSRGNRSVSQHDISKDKADLNDSHQFSGLFSELNNWVGDKLDGLYDSTIGSWTDTQDWFDGSDLAIVPDILEDVALGGLSVINPVVGLGLLGTKAIESSAPDILSAAGGRDVVTGRELTPGESLAALGSGVLNAGLTMMPGGVGKIAKGSAKRAFNKELAGDLAGSDLSALSEIANAKPGSFADSLKSAGRSLASDFKETPGVRRLFDNGTNETMDAFGKGTADNVIEKLKNVDGFVVNEGEDVVDAAKKALNDSGITSLDNTLDRLKDISESGKSGINAGNRRMVNSASRIYDDQGNLVDVAAARNLVRDLADNGYSNVEINSILSNLKTGSGKFDQYADLPDVLKAISGNPPSTSSVWTRSPREIDELKKYDQAIKLRDSYKDASKAIVEDAPQEKVKLKKKFKNLGSRAAGGLGTAVRGDKKYGQLVRDYGNKSLWKSTNTDAPGKSLAWALAAANRLAPVVQGTLANAAYTDDYGDALLGYADNRSIAPLLLTALPTGRRLGRKMTRATGTNNAFAQAMSNAARGNALGNYMSDRRFYENSKYSDPAYEAYMNAMQDRENMEGDE